jgi:acyl-CoA hydrolase
LTFVTLEKDGKRAEVPPLVAETDEDRQMMEDARQRRDEHLARREQEIKKRNQ